MITSEAAQRFNFTGGFNYRMVKGRYAIYSHAADRVDDDTMKPRDVPAEEAKSINERYASFARVASDAVENNSIMARVFAAKKMAPKKGIARNINVL